MKCEFSLAELEYLKRAIDIYKEGMLFCLHQVIGELKDQAKHCEHFPPGFEFKTDDFQIMLNVECAQKLFILAQKINDLLREAQSNGESRD